MDEILVGRTQDVSLSDDGRHQAQVLGARLTADPPVALHVSPRLRAQQTATAIAAGTNTLVETDPAFDELDFGEWSGRSFHTLQDDERWRQWNRERTLVRAPQGESIHDVEQRVIARLRRLRDENIAQIDRLIADEDADERDFLRRYYTRHLRFSLGEREKQGLLAFAQACANQNLIPTADLTLDLV